MSFAPKAPSIHAPKLECVRCGHKWRPRGDEAPRVCPNCNQPWWFEGRGKDWRSGITDDDSSEEPQQEAPEEPAPS
jgi:hypothetical protein